MRRTYTTGLVSGLRYGATGATPTLVYGRKATGWEMDPLERQRYDMLESQEQRADQNRELATEAWDRYKQGVERANEETREDREDILGRLESYEEGYNEDWMSSVLAREKAYWDEKKTQTLERAEKQMANMGRTASPYLMGAINRQLTAQAADAIQQRRFQLEQERDARKQWALQMRNQVYSDTQRQTMNPQTAVGIMQSLGQGASTVMPERV